MYVTFGELSGYLISKSSQTNGIIICGGFPSRPQIKTKKGSKRGSSNYYLEPAKLLAKNLDWDVLLFNYRGIGNSEGNFSMKGWLGDVSEAIKFMSESVEEIWLVGFGLGGSLAICAGAKQKEVAGVVAGGAAADFSQWAKNTKQLLEHCRNVGMITDEDFPANPDSWEAELTSLEIEKQSKKLGRSKPLLVIHGSDNETIPSLEARAIADAHGKADVRIIEGVANQLAVNPRVISIISGWLYRNASISTVPQK